MILVQHLLLSGVEETFEPAKEEIRVQFPGCATQRMCCSFHYIRKMLGSCVGSDLLSEWALSTANSQPAVIRFSRNKKEYLILTNLQNYIKLYLR